MRVLREPKPRSEGLVNAVAATLLPWCRRRLERRAGRPWVLGLQGPQGCGKSTAAAALVEAARDEGRRAVTVSIDDFYLTYAEQRALAERHPGNPYLLYRGYPGTHDVALGGRVIDALAGAARAPRCSYRPTTSRPTRAAGIARPNRAGSA